MNIERTVCAIINVNSCCRGRCKRLVLILGTQAALFPKLLSFSDLPVKMVFDTFVLFRMESSMYPSASVEDFYPPCYLNNRISAP